MATLQFSQEGLSLTVEDGGDVVAALRILAGGGGCDWFLCWESRSATLNIKTLLQILFESNNGKTALCISIDEENNSDEPNAQEFKDFSSSATLTVTWFDPDEKSDPSEPDDHCEMPLEVGKVAGENGLLKLDESKYQVAAGISPVGFPTLFCKLKHAWMGNNRTNDQIMVMTLISNTKKLGFYACCMGWVLTQGDGIEVCWEGNDSICIGIYDFGFLCKRIFAAEEVKAQMMYFHVQDGVPNLVRCPLGSGKLGDLYFFTPHTRLRILLDNVISDAKFPIKASSVPVFPLISKDSLPTGGQTTCMLSLAIPEGALFENAVTELVGCRIDMATLQFSPEGLSLTVKDGGRVVAALCILADGGGCGRFLCSGSSSAELNITTFLHILFEADNGKSALSISIDPREEDSDEEYSPDEPNIFPATLRVTWFDPSEDADQETQDDSCKMNLQVGEVDEENELLDFDESEYLVMAGISSPAGVDTLFQKLKEARKKDDRTNDDEIKVMVIVNNWALGFLTRGQGWVHKEEAGIEVNWEEDFGICMGIYDFALSQQRK